MFSLGFIAFFTPKDFAVAGINCIKPIAPAFDIAFGLNPDSCFIKALTSFSSTP